MKHGWNDTIVALATPPGVSAIGVIRLSGEQTFEIAGQLFSSKNLADQPSHSVHVGLLKDGDVTLDEVVITTFRNPHSYTGEDVVEISGHGSPFILQRIIEACISRGARLAKPGEFTQRAFLNGKMDLAQAEAVADLIASNSLLSQHAAMHSMRGGFSRQLRGLREKLIQFSALIELELDFSQEDVEFADRKLLEALIDECDKLVASLIDSFKLGNVLRNGISVAIIGKPNAGKSTLLNVLLNEDRAIVSDIPGTTRDTIEEVVNIDGILFRLIDTAGIREHKHDVIESIGVQKTIEKMKQAGLIIYVLDAAAMSKSELPGVREQLSEQKGRFLLVANKMDLMDGNAFHDQDMLFISAVTGQNIDKLKRAMVDSVLEGAVQAESTVVTNARHIQSLQRLHTSLNDVTRAMKEKIPGDLLALDLRRALHYLGEITGEVTTDEQLDYIFSKFCIGK